MDDDAAMETSPSYFDPEDLSAREQYRRYRKRLSSAGPSSLNDGASSSGFKEASLLFDGGSIQRPPNAAVLLEGIKQEMESGEGDGLDGSAFRAVDASRKRVSGGLEPGLLGSLLKPCKEELEDEEAAPDCGDSTFSLFASLFDSALHGLVPFTDLILHFENTCRNISESIRYGGTGRHRVLEDKLMRQRARFLLDEAASWSLLWHWFGKGNEELPVNLFLSPTNSHQEACQFVMADITAQLCLRVVQWLEGLASEALELEKKVRGSHVGSYLPSTGVWHHTQRRLKRKTEDQNIVRHLDFDAPTRENAQIISDDKRNDESLLEDVWILIRAGRVEEAAELCRSAGQPWRAASLCPFGGFDHFPSSEALQRNGRTRMLQAIELESGLGHQWSLWRWASYCASEKIAEQGGRFETAVYASQCSNLKRMLPVCTDWESACWALAKSWLDVQVDSVLAQFSRDRLQNLGDDISEHPNQGVLGSHSSRGPENWPSHVIDQQPRDVSSLLQKLHSSDIVHEAVSRACKEQHRQIEMNLMKGDIAHLLDLLWTWISPTEDDQSVRRPHGDPQMIRFAAHIVLVLRYIVPDEVKDAFQDKLVVVGDRIIFIYAMFLFSKQHEELIGIYASQLEPHRCIDLFVHMMEIRLNDSVQVKYKIFLSAMDHLPFSLGDDRKACFEDIIERVLSRSRELEVNKYEEKSCNVAEQHRLQSLEKAKAIQWLCFTPPSTIADRERVNARLLLKALMYSNVLFREFALISLWRVPKMPVGAHLLLGYLAEPLKQPTDAFLEEHGALGNMHEFEDWREYFACDATYRSWLKIELENADIPHTELSTEEKDRAIAVATETLNSSLALSLRKESQWLSTAENCPYESTENVFIEVYATAMLCLPSGECLQPDATLCTTLSSALYSAVSEEDFVKRQPVINVYVSSKDKFSIEVSIRCTAVNGDGLGLSESNDGGILASILAAGFKGELSRFQPGVTMEISRLDAWYSSGGRLDFPATYIVKGLCRRCCLPEITLRCMQVSISLAEFGDSCDRRDELIDFISSSQNGMLSLFSSQQLQEFMMFERECILRSMEFQEEASLDV